MRRRPTVRRRRPACRAATSSPRSTATPSRTPRDLAKKVGALSPGAKVTLSVLRKGEQKSIALTLKQMPDDKQAKADTGKEQSDGSSVPHLGLSLAPASAVDGAGGKGVVVTGIDPDGTAAEHGLQTGDIILDVGGRAVGNVSEMRKVLADATESRPRQCADAGEVGRRDAVRRAAAQARLSRGERRGRVARNVGLLGRHKLRGRASRPALAFCASLSASFRTRASAIRNP